MISLTCFLATAVGKTAFYMYKPIGELARALQSFKRPTGFHQTAAVPIIGNFNLAVGLRQMLLLPEF